MGGHGHHPAPVIKSVINYEIPEAAHGIETFKAPDYFILLNNNRLNAFILAFP